MSGLNGSTTLRVYPCMMEQLTKKFFVWLRDVDLQSFNKATLLNLTGFAEDHQCEELYLVLDRDHPQKGRIRIETLHHFLEQFKKMFTVLDAERVGRKEITTLIADKARSEKTLLRQAIYKLDL